LLAVLANSSGKSQRAITKNGTPGNPYRSPAYSNKGVITAVRGRRDLYFFNRRGGQLRKKRSISAGSLLAVVRGPKHHGQRDADHGPGLRGLEPQDATHRALRPEVGCEQPHREPELVARRHASRLGGEGWYLGQPDRRWRGRLRGGTQAADCRRIAAGLGSGQRA
jgi:hypothetical protein